MLFAICCFIIHLLCEAPSFPFWSPEVEITWVCLMSIWSSSLWFISITTYGVPLNPSLRVTERMPVKIYLELAVITNWVTAQQEGWWGRPPRHLPPLGRRSRLWCFRREILHIHSKCCLGFSPDETVWQRSHCWKGSHGIFPWNSPKGLREPPQSTERRLGQKWSLSAIRLNHRFGEHQTRLTPQIHQLQVQQGAGLDMLQQQVLEGM